MKKIRLLLIEDNRLIREGICSILKAHKDIDIVAASGDGKDSLARIKELKPNVVLLDLGLRSQNSLHVVEIIKIEIPKAKIIVMDLAPVQADILQYVKAGANGFILKDGSLNDFYITIRTVSEGSTVLPPIHVDSLFSEIVNQAVREGRPTLKEEIRMTKPEKEIIHLYGDGMSNKEISHKIRISTNNVKGHFHNIMEKLTLHNHLESAKYFYADQSIGQLCPAIK